MHRLIVIGTLHAGLTPEEELIAILERHTPSQLLVEIADQDLQSVEIDSYPPEMVAAYKWAKQKNISVRGFDSKINILVDGLSEADNRRAIEEQKKIMGTLTWKEFNKPENLRRLDVVPWLIDSAKKKKRDLEMINNLRNVVDAEGVVVIVTGCGNLKTINKEFPEAELLLTKQ